MAGLKKLKIPNDIVFINPITNEELGKNNFSEFCHLFLNLEFFKESIENLKSALALSTVLVKTKPDEQVILNADDLLKLSKVVTENFTKVLNQNPIFLMQLLPYLDVLINAEDA